MTRRETAMAKTEATAASAPAAERGGAAPRLSDLLGAARDLIDEANRSSRSLTLPCGSRALAFAIEAGLEPQMAYTVDQTVLYTGINRKTLYAEHNAGRLKFVVPGQNSKGSRITVDEVDRWMEASSI